MSNAPCIWYLYLKAKLEKLGFKQSEHDPGIYFGRGMALILYVDDLLVCGPDDTKIEQVFKDLKEEWLRLTREEGAGKDAFHFLGIEMSFTK